MHKLIDHTQKHGITHQDHLLRLDNTNVMLVFYFGNLELAAILDFRSCDIWEHFYVHRWVDHTPKHGIRHQDHLSRLNNTKVMLVFNFSYFGWRPYWIWPKKVPSRIFPPGILIDLVNRHPKGNNYEGFKTIPIFSRSNSIFMRLKLLQGRPECWWIWV